MKIELTPEQKQFFADQLAIVKESNPALAGLMQKELEVIKKGGFDEKRQDVFLKEVQKMSTVKIPNFVDLKDFQTKGKATFEDILNEVKSYQ